MNAERFKRKLIEDGLTMKQWSEKNGHSYSLVTKVACGERKGVRGRGNVVLRDIYKYINSGKPVRAAA